DDASREALEEFDLGLGEAGAATGDNVADASARHGNRVHVAFDENGEILAAEGVFGAVHVVENVALRIDGSFRRVEIFRLVVAQRAAAKGYNFPGVVGDGKCNAAAEAVEKAAPLVSGDEAGIGEEVFFVFCAEETQQG